MYLLFSVLYVAFFKKKKNTFLLFSWFPCRPFLEISSWPSNTAGQSESEGWDAWPTSSSASQNPSLSVPSAQLRQRSAFTPATMTTGSSPSPVLGQVTQLKQKNLSQTAPGCFKVVVWLLTVFFLFRSVRGRRLKVFRLRLCIPGERRRTTTSTSTKMRYLVSFFFFCCFILLHLNAFVSAKVHCLHGSTCLTELIIPVVADNNSIRAAGHVVVRWAADRTERLVPQKLCQAHLCHYGSPSWYSSAQQKYKVS